MKLFISILLVFFISSCSTNETMVENEKAKPGLFSKDSSKGLSITDFINREENEGKSFYVNSFLWRATLDVFSFAPFQSTDAFGGIIVTEWFKKDNEEIKLTALISSRELRSEGISIKAFIKNKKNEILEDINLARKIEDLILTKARVLRIQNKLK